MLLSPNFFPENHAKLNNTSYIVDQISIHVFVTEKLNHPADTTAVSQPVGIYVYTGFIYQYCTSQAYPILVDQIIDSKVVNEVVDVIVIRGECVIVIKAIYFNVFQTQLIVGKDTFIMDINVCS